MASGTVAAIRAEAGNLRYEYYQSLEDPETVLLIDSWESQEAIDIHHASPMMATLAAMMAVVSAKADDGLTDVTAQFVTNASFEADDISALSPVNNQADGLRGYTVTAPSGWTVTNDANAVSLIVTADCYTDNNFGKVTTLADGKQAYYLRMGWNTGIISLRQTIKSLPKGKYMLQVGVRSAYANQATSRFELTAGNDGKALSFTQGTQGCFTSMKWNDETLYFEQKADGNATITIDVVWQSGGSCVMFDNVRLFLLSDDYTVPDDPDIPSNETALADFVGENDMKGDLLQMLADFATYMKNDFQDCQWPNSIDEACGCFRGENTMANDERGVRPNADLSMTELRQYINAHSTPKDLETLVSVSSIMWCPFVSY